MRYSIRTLAIVVTFVGVWLGALLSGSMLVWDLVAYLGLLFTALALGLAICDRNSDRRLFWIGFTIAAVGNLALSSLPLGTANQPVRHIEDSLSQLFLKDVSSRPGSGEFMEVPAGSNSNAMRVVSVAALAYQEEQNHLRCALAVAISLLAGALVGSICQACGRMPNLSN